MVDKTGNFTELERVGDLLYQAPEVQRACPGSKIVYSAAGTSCLQQLPYLNKGAQNHDAAAHLGLWNPHASQSVPAAQIRLVHFSADQVGERLSCALR